MLTRKIATKATCFGKTKENQKTMSSEMLISFTELQSQVVIFCGLPARCSTLHITIVFRFMNIKMLIERHLFSSIMQLSLENFPTFQWATGGSCYFLSFFIQWILSEPYTSSPAPGNQANSSVVKGDLLSNYSKPYVPANHPSWLTPKHFSSILFLCLFSLSDTHSFQCKTP